MLIKYGRKNGITKTEVMQLIELYCDFGRVKIT